MKIPVGSGMSKIKREHIDIWFYDNFDPLVAVVSVEQV